MHIVLTIAGSDSSGCAGIQADIRAITASGGHAASVVSCVTAQSSLRLLASFPVPGEAVRRQLETVFSDLPAMRRSCNPRLRSALRNWAKTAIRCEPRSRELYNDLRARGHRHERALRGLADRLLLRLVACLRDCRRYDPDRWVSRESAA